MYRPVIFMSASDHQSTTTAQDSKTTAEPTTKISSSSSSSRRAIRSTNKPSSSAKPNNKKPQRGVGVAQLERLRLQRAGNAAAFTNQVQILPHPSKPQTQILQTPHHQFQCSCQNPGSQADALCSVPVLYGASGYEGGGGGVSGGGVFGYGYNVRLQNEIGGLVMEPNSQYGVAGAHQDVGAVFHVSKKQQPLASAAASSECRCCCCNQNKILSSGNNMNFGEFPAIFPMVSGSNPPGFNSHNSPNIRLASENGGSGFCGGAYLSSRSGVVDESVEVRAVHRKGRQAGGDILMEYEFFPDHNRNNRNNNISSVISSSAAGTYPMEHDFVPLSTNSSSVGRSSEASDHHQHPDGAACIEGNQMRMMMSSSGYSPVDLSLKLSF